MDKLLSVPQLEEETGLTQRFWRKVIFEKRIPYLKLGPSRNGLVRVRQSDLEAWLKANRHEATTG